MFRRLPVGRAFVFLNSIKFQNQKARMIDGSMQGIFLGDGGYIDWNLKVQFFIYNIFIVVEMIILAIDIQDGRLYKFKVPLPLYLMFPLW